MSGPPGARPRAGLGDWPVWGDQPPELWFEGPPSARVPAGRTPPPAPSTPAGAPRTPSSRMAFAGFILGLLGACLSWLPLAGLACAVFGAVFSFQARRAIGPGRQDRGLATAGLVLGCTGVVLGVSASAILSTVALDAAFNALYGG